MPTSPRNEASNDGGVSRRDFMKTTAAQMAVLAASGLGGWRALSAGDGDKPIAAPAVAVSETLVATLFKTFSDKQKDSTLFPYDSPLRTAVDNNWQITKYRVGEEFTADQQELIRKIFVGMHSDEYAETVIKQVDHDSGGNGGLSKSSIAIFGEPGAGKSEFVLTGRHCTRRCGGDSAEGAAFGGPIFYGHAAGGFNEKATHPGNAYWYQAKRANELFQALDGKQRGIALLDEPREENGTDTVKLAGKDGKLRGLPASEMSKDQRELLRKVMGDVLAPFRKSDVDETMKFIEAADRFNQLHISYFKNEDIGNDGVWDVWQIEGPNMVWYFRGKPHVHVWVNVHSNA